MSNKTQNDSPEKTASAPRRLSYLALGLLVLAVFYLGFSYVFEYGIFRNDDPIKTVSSCQENPQLEEVTIEANDKQLRAEKASTTAEQQQGLSDRECLGDGKAMLFPYANSGSYCFWMKNMKFAIDMIWLDQEKKVVTIHHDVAPDTYPEAFCPEGSAQYVVEVNAGVAKASGWQNGTQFSF